MKKNKKLAMRIPSLEEVIATITKEHQQEFQTEPKKIKVKKEPKVPKPKIVKVESPSERKSFTPETMEFRNLDREAKFNSVYELCKKLGRMPRTYRSLKYSPTQYERVRAQFIINMTSKRNRGELNKHDMKLLDAVDGYAKDRRKSIPLVEKIQIVHNVLKTTGKLPDTSSSEHRLWNSIRHMKPSDIPSDFRAMFEELIQIKSVPSSRVSVSARLELIIKWHSDHGRLPRQHADDDNECKLANAMSSIKQHIKKFPLTSDQMMMYNKIIELMPSRKNRN